MAGNTIPQNIRLSTNLPKKQWLVDQFDDLIGYIAPNGRITMLPAGVWDDSLTAAAGGGQSGALALNYRNSRVTTVATIADSVVLPVGVPGMCMSVVNAAANSMNLYPATGDQINALGANAAFAIAGGKTAQLECTGAGQWHAILTA